jgi:Carboxypeptidase regulatory-like domain
VKAWTDWEIARDQVAISGRVVDGGDEPVAGAEVTVTVMPEEFQRKLAGAAKVEGGGWKYSDQRLDRSFTKADGIYYFIDLPAGKYTVKGVDKRSGTQAEKTVSVSWDKDGKVQMAVADLKLSKAAGER